jgi:hypothetical protein
MLEVIPRVHTDRCANPGKTLDHRPDQRAAALPVSSITFNKIEQLASFLRRHFRLTIWRGPRTEAAGYEYGGEEGITVIFLCEAVDGTCSTMSPRTVPCSLQRLSTILPPDAYAEKDGHHDFGTVLIRCDSLDMPISS